MKIFCALIDLEQKQVPPRNGRLNSPRKMAEGGFHVAQVSHLLEDWRNTWEHVRMVSIGAKMVRIRRYSPRSRIEFAEISSVSFADGSDALNSPSAGLRDYGHHPQVGLLTHTCVSRPADEHRWRDAGEASRHCDNHISTLSSYSASNFSVREI